MIEKELAQMCESNAYARARLTKPDLTVTPRGLRAEFGARSSPALLAVARHCYSGCNLPLKSVTQDISRLEAV
jgi:hypothetical protein